MKKIIKKLKRLVGIKEKKDSARIKWSVYGRVWREIGLPNWRWLLLGGLMTSIAAGAEGFTVTIVKKVIDQGFIDKDMASLYFFGAQIIMAFFLKGLFNYGTDLVMTKTGLRAATRLKARIYDRLVKTNIDEIQRDGVGRFTNYFQMQAQSVLNLVTNQVISLIQNIATMSIMIGIMLWSAPQMLAALIFLVPGILIPMSIITHQKVKLGRKSFGIANDSVQHINQTLAGIKTIQAFDMEKFESEKYDGLLEKTMKNSYRTTSVSALRVPIIETIISIGLGAALVIGGYFISTGALTTGDFTAFILALTAAYKPVKSLSNLNDGMIGGCLAAEALFAFMDSKPAIRDAKDAAELSGREMSVEFRNVSFAYNPADGDVLRGVSFAAPAGKIFAFVGPSGGGKTTTFSLLERFYDPRDGEILINGKNIKNFTLASLRANISEVSQDVFLFNGTIEENIRYGRPGATQEEIEAAAKVANAHDFITKLPGKYKSRVGERGTMLSGGQKQRIAIARAVLKDAPILLLDEATSALDTESEKLIQAALSSLMAGRTVFVIAHRLSTILDADTINVVKNGQIVERGTDAELCAIDGEYKKLRDIQFKKSGE
ncbi:MAG: ABC transporter ATP-binding protein/permease [Rickettsiales bacterium]|jgi:subfamily B ATP-binding cassette protein MsbA|nr:ABC transporter ATP-binding protein/permease [Rickettsiales bacterium]